MSVSTYSYLVTSRKRTFYAVMGLLYYIKENIKFTTQKDENYEQLVDPVR